MHWVALLKRVQAISIGISDYLRSQLKTTVWTISSFTSAERTYWAIGRKLVGLEVANCAIM